MQPLNKILFKPRNLISGVSSFFHTTFRHSIIAKDSLLYRLVISSNAKDKLLFTKNSHLYHTAIKNTGHNNRIYINGSGIYHQSSIEIEGNNNRIIVGNNCCLSNLNVVLKGNGCIIEIAQGTFSNGTSMYCIGDGHRIIIGKDCLFAKGTELWSSDSHSILSIESGEIINNQKHDVIIGDHVWMAENSRILKGVTVADNCVIGMCAVLTKNTVPNSIYVGIPAKMVKQDITWKR